MLFRFVAVALVLGLVQAQNGVDPNKCTEVSGGYGVTVQCPAGYVASALCSSGRNADCNKSYTILRCCQIVSQQNLDSCDQQDGGYGVYLGCTHNKAVTSVCSSGRNGDCGAGAYSRIQCCDGLGLSITNQCNWLHAGYGQTVSCGNRQVIAGVCTSGKNADCNGQYTGIQCCYLD